MTAILAAFRELSAAPEKEEPEHSGEGSTYVRPAPRAVRHMPHGPLRSGDPATGGTRERAFGQAVMAAEREKQKRQEKVSERAKRNVKEGVWSALHYGPSAGVHARLFNG
ncbi:MAG TPA: hypothetical protein VNS49_09020 [Streptomyces sp.]|nr:hypothetical protein [Streptomyces sp.]